MKDLIVEALYDWARTYNGCAYVHLFEGDEVRIDGEFVIKDLAEELAEHMPPVPMILHCPKCHVQHIDAPEECPDEGCPHFNTPHSHPEFWMNPPHRSHLCGNCGTIWRPADVCTTGVASIETTGQDDNWLSPLDPVRDEKNGTG